MHKHVVAPLLLTAFVFAHDSVTGDFTQYAANLHAAAVPEPEAWASMLAGLGVVGAIARRRRAT